MKTRDMTPERAYHLAPFTDHAGVHGARTPEEQWHINRASTHEAWDWPTGA